MGDIFPFSQSVMGSALYLPRPDTCPALLPPFPLPSPFPSPPLPRGSFHGCGLEGALAPPAVFTYGAFSIENIWERASGIVSDNCGILANWTHDQHVQIF